MSDLIPFDKNSNPRSERSELNHRQPFLENINCMFDALFDNDAELMESFEQSFKIDVQNVETEYVIQADLPGVKKEDLKIKFNDGTLTIGAHKSDALTASSENYIHRERFFSCASRSIRLENIDADNIKAMLEEGVLTVILPKNAVARNSRNIIIE